MALGLGALAVWLGSRGNDPAPALQAAAPEPIAAAPELEPSPAESPQAAPPPTPSSAPPNQETAPPAPPEPRTIEVRSDPEGAEVFVGHERIGMTPTTVRVLPSDHPRKLRLLKPGFLQDEYVIEAGSPDVVLRRMSPEPPNERKPSSKGTAKRKSDDAWLD